MAHLRSVLKTGTCNEKEVLRRGFWVLLPLYMRRRTSKVTIKQIPLEAIMEILVAAVTYGQTGEIKIVDAEVNEEALWAGRILTITGENTADSEGRQRQTNNICGGTQAAMFPVWQKGPHSFGKRTQKGGSGGTRISRSNLGNRGI